MSLPFVVSVPHGGVDIPQEVADLNLLTAEQIAEDGDLGAAEIYAPLRSVAKSYVTTNIGRAFIDMNRTEDDRRKDGIVKTHTCVDVPIYRSPLPEETVQRLIANYHRPYHQRLRDAADGALFGIDCHTMFATGPAVGPDTGKSRPHVLLADVNGTTFPAAWTALLVKRFSEAFEMEVAQNAPFIGGFVIRDHHKELPWIMLELSRGPFLEREEKARRVQKALELFCADIHP